MAVRGEYDLSNESEETLTSYDCNFHGYPVWFAEGGPFLCPLKCPMQMRVGEMWEGLKVGDWS